MKSKVFESPARVVFALVLALSGTTLVGLTPNAVAASTASVSFERQQLAKNPVVFNRQSLAPQVRITSPLDGAFIAPGDSRIGAGDPNGTGFAIVAEIVTRDNNQ